ncbi:MAG: gamma-butyrobetaine hydroxylase-like domain-containing protein [Thiotrichales bacterium]
MRPTEINLHQRSHLLEIEFEDGSRHKLSCEYLRVYSPSAEVRGHGPGEEKLQLGKESVGIDAIEPVGNYAVKLVFDDGHNTGMYSWDYLYDLAVNQEQYWQRYLERLKEAGYTRKVANFGH